MLSFDIMGPYFFEDDNGIAVTVAAGPHVHMIVNFSLHSWQIIVRLVNEHGFNRLYGLAMPQEYLRDVCLLIVPSLEMRIFLGLRDRPILRPTISSCGGGYLKRRVFGAPPPWNIRDSNVKCKNKLLEFLERYCAV